MIERRLIVNADDFGMSRGITDAIVLAHRYGIVTSTSLMPNMPAAEYAVGRLTKNARLAVGVHLNVSAGRPLLPPREVPSLVDASGTFHPQEAMIRKLWRWQIAGHELEAEFRAQIQWMKDRGVPPTHADSHQHMHIYPAAVGPFARALAAEGICCTRAPRCAVFPKPGFGPRALGAAHEGGFVRRLFVQSYRTALQLAAFRALRMPDSRIAFLSRDRRDLAALGERWNLAIASIPPGTFELACHPGLFEPGFSETDRIREQRELELGWLTSRDLRDAAERNGVRLIDYRDLSKERATRPAAAGAPVLE